MSPQVRVAFFRNMNLGQLARSKSPTSAVLRGAFDAAGATEVVNFQTNGTVVFSSPDPDVVVAGVRTILQGATGYSDAVMVRNAAWVVDLGQRLDPALPAGEVALFDATGVPAVQLPWTGAGPGLTVLELDTCHAVTSWSPTAAGSGANPILTALLGVPVTCRGVPTMIRLAGRLATL